MKLTSVVFAFGLLAGCGGSHGTDPPDDSCECVCSPVPGSTGDYYRNVYNGECDFFPAMTCEPAVAGCTSCDGGGEAAVAACPAEPLLECDGFCATHTDEQSCLADESCHAAYSGSDFWACWDMGDYPGGTQYGLSCPGLDPLTCASAVGCASEFQAATATVVVKTAGPGPGGCGSFSNGMPVGGMPVGGSGETWVGCIAVGSGASGSGSGSGGGASCGVCGSDQHCVVECPCDGCGDACVPTCEPDDVGQCMGTVTCTDPEPACPSGTTAGIDNGCYTGYCIPNSDCGPAACASISDEADCTARPDCEAIYAGSNCTCDDSGCTCEMMTFERCASRSDSATPG